jgi:flavin reductase
VPAEPTVELFRRAAGRFATGITVVTTLVDGLDHAMTANSFTSVSLEPLLVLVCVERQTRFHDALLASGRWVVSVLPASARDAAVWLATKGRPLAGQLDRVPHTRAPLTGAAVIDGALSVLECDTAATYPGGDHTVVLGRVLAVQLTDNAGDEPLLYYRSHYTALPAR